MLGFLPLVDHQHIPLLKNRPALGHYSGAVGTAHQDDEYLRRDTQFLDRPPNPVPVLRHRHLPQADPVIVLIERRAEHHKIPCLDCGISVWNHILAAPPEHHHQRVGGQLTLPDGPPHPRVARADREAGQVELPLVLVVVEGTADALSTVHHVQLPRRQRQ